MLFIAFLGRIRRFFRLFPLIFTLKHVKFTVFYRVFTRFFTLKARKNAPFLPCFGAFFTKF